MNILFDEYCSSSGNSNKARDVFASCIEEIIKNNYIDNSFNNLLTKCNKKTKESCIIFETEETPISLLDKYKKLEIYH